MLIMSVFLFVCVEQNERLQMAFVRQSLFVCVFVTYISYASRLFSAVLVTSFTVERCFGVAFPLRRGILSTRAHACKVIIVESVMCFVLTSYTLFTIGVVDESYGTECDIIPGRHQVYLILNTLILICGSIVVPIIVICTLNTYLVYRIFKRRKFVQKNIRFHDGSLLAGLSIGVALQRGNGNGDEKAHYAATAAGKIGDTAMRRTSKANGKNASSMTNATAKHDEVAGLLLLVSSAFVLTNVPYCIAFLLLFFRHFGIGSPAFLAMSPENFFVAKYTTSVFYYLNYSVNFLLYYVWARRFRHELRQMLCCGRRCRCVAKAGYEGYCENGGVVVLAKYQSPDVLPPVFNRFVITPKRCVYKLPVGGPEGENLVINKFVAP